MSLAFNAGHASQRTQQTQRKNLDVVPILAFLPLRRLRQNSAQGPCVKRKTGFSFFVSLNKCVLGAGVIYLYDCPVQRFIPIYLVVGGVFTVAQLGVGLVKSACQRRVNDRERIEKSCDSGASIVACFVTAWFIAG